MHNIVSGFALLTLLMLSGCGSSQQLIGETELVGTSGDMGSWVKEDRTFFEKDGVMYAKAQVTQRYDLAVGLREVKFEGIKNVAEGIDTKLSTEFGQLAAGRNVSPEGLSTAIEDAGALLSENHHVQGLALSRSYWERWKRRTNTGVEYYYDIHGLVELPVHDYNESRNRILRDLERQYQKENNK
ncbi:MAG: hypothetical protein Q8R28_02115, partial [Dehalococcoidia bacterium]|nr:hypothetical protein [Dehalococcoidia bacterium]